MALTPFHIVLLALTSFIAAMVAAIAGFGGAAILMPVLIAFFGVREAVPILTLAQLFGNGSRVWLNREELNKPVLVWFSIGSLPAAIVGGLLFSKMSIPLLSRLIGAFLCGSVIWRRWEARPKMHLTAKAFFPLGAAFSFLSALIGSVGPLMAPFFLSYGLARGAYIGTEAAATVIMHLGKSIAYGGTSLLTANVLAIGCSLSPCMIAGSWAGKKILGRTSDRAFVILVETILLGSGAYFLIHG